jgi:DNA recombination protein RmuC
MPADFELLTSPDGVIFGGMAISVETWILIGLLVFGFVLLVVLLVIFGRRGGANMQSRLEEFGRGLVQSGRVLREEIERVRGAQAEESHRLREEVASRLGEGTSAQKEQLEQFRQSIAAFREANDRHMTAVRETLERKLDALQKDNALRLEEMRKTVDEKLQGTLEKRLGESFKQVSERLENVHKALGEMQELATGVGDLKKVLTNVKTRGTWGEIQLGNILELLLTPEQYAANVATRPGSSERVEFAVKMPGMGGTDGDPVWLPIDSKFPKEDYVRLIEAAEQGIASGVESAAKLLEASVRESAKTISAKYVSPPNTTDFAVLFLPTESLYAEILRRPGLAEMIQRESRVTIAGPTTLAALLNSLRMGFRTLAIQKRSSEVWEVLGGVKNEFSKFGGVLDKVQKKLSEASSVVEQAGVRRRVLERRLSAVEALPGQAAPELPDECPSEVPPPIDPDSLKS